MNGQSVQMLTWPEVYHFIVVGVCVREREVLFSVNVFFFSPVFVSPSAFS